MSRGSCTNPKENFRLRQEELDKEELKNYLDSMIECEGCGYGFVPKLLQGDLCDDCLDNRNYWLEMEEEINNFIDLPRELLPPSVPPENSSR